MLRSNPEVWFSKNFTPFKDLGGEVSLWLIQLYDLWVQIITTPWDKYKSRNGCQGGEAAQSSTWWPPLRWGGRAWKAAGTVTRTWSSKEVLPAPLSWRSSFFSVRLNVSICKKRGWEHPLLMALIGGWGEIRHAKYTVRTPPTVAMIMAWYTKSQLGFKIGTEPSNETRAE